MGGTGNGHMGAGNAGRGGFNNDGGGSGSDRPGFNDMKIGTWNDAPATSNAGNTSGNGNYPKSIIQGCSVRPKPLFWFRFDTKTETQIG